jgi:hypothetical protein
METARASSKGARASSMVAAPANSNAPTARRPGATAKGNWRGSPPEWWQDGGEGGTVEQRKQTGVSWLDAGEAELHGAVSSRSGSYSAAAT